MAMKLLRWVLFALCLAVAILLGVAVGYDIWTHAGRHSGALSGKAVVELALISGISLMFFKWSHDLWRTFMRRR